MSGLRLAAVLSLGLCALLAPGAWAETQVSFYLGAARTRDSDLKVNQPSTGSNATFGGVSWDDASFELPPYYGLRLDHYFAASPSWGVGLEFTHYKIYADVNRTVSVSGTWLAAPVNTVAPLSQRVQKFNITHGVNYFGANVFYRWMQDRSERFPQGRLQPYVGGGPIYFILHGENAINNLANEEKYESLGFGFQVLGGLRYGLTRRTSIFVEIKYSSGTAKVNAAGAGQAETDLRTYHGLVGLSYRF